MIDPQEGTADICEMALVKFQQDVKDMTRKQKGEVNIFIAVFSLTLYEAEMKISVSF